MLVPGPRRLIVDQTYTSCSGLQVIIKGWPLGYRAVTCLLLCFDAAGPFGINHQHITSASRQNGLHRRDAMHQGPRRARNGPRSPHDPSASIRTSTSAGDWRRRRALRPRSWAASAMAAIADRIPTRIASHHITSPSAVSSSPTAPPRPPHDDGHPMRPMPSRFFHPLDRLCHYALLHAVELAAVGARQARATRPGTHARITLHRREACHSWRLMPWSKQKETENGQESKGCDAGMVPRKQKLLSSVARASRRIERVPRICNSNMIIPTGKISLPSGLDPLVIRNLGLGS